MSITMEAQSTEYIYTGVTGTPPTTAEVAFVAAGVAPASGDWHAATLITAQNDPLWDDAQASGVKGDYYLAILIGSFTGTSGVTPLTLAAGDWQEWLRLTGATERPVRVAPVTVTIVTA